MSWVRTWWLDNAHGLASDQSSFRVASGGGDPFRAFLFLACLSWRSAPPIFKPAPSPGNGAGSPRRAERGPSVVMAGNGNSFGRASLRASRFAVHAGRTVDQSSPRRSITLSRSTRAGPMLKAIFSRFANLATRPRPHAKASHRGAEAPEAQFHRTPPVRLSVDQNRTEILKAAVARDADPRGS